MSSPSLDVPVARRSFDSVPNLIRRAPQQFQKSANWRKRASAIDATRQLNTEHKASPYRSPGSFWHRLPGYFSATKFASILSISDAQSN
jgi:hypothetical protein